MRDRAFITLVLVTILIYLAAVVSVFALTEYDRKPVVQQKVREGDYSYLFDFYLFPTPALEDRPVYGDPAAPITLILYSDVQCAGCKQFLFGLFPDIEKELIETGKARFYHKHYLTRTDVRTRSDTYLYSQALLCFEQLQPENYWAYYHDLHLTAPRDLAARAASYGLAEETFNNCIDTTVFAQTSEDLSEVLNFNLVGTVPALYIGINGQDNTLLQGIPSKTRLTQIIRTYQIRLGD